MKRPPGPARIPIIAANFSNIKPHQDTMPPPSQLFIATSSVQRLVKEEASYYKELQQQEARLEKLQTQKDDDENAEYKLKQEASRYPLYILFYPMRSSTGLMARRMRPLCLPYVSCTESRLSDATPPLTEFTNCEGLRRRRQEGLSIAQPASGSSTRLLGSSSYCSSKPVCQLTLHPPQRAAIEETKAVFPPLRQRITDALQKLEDQIEVAQQSGASPEEIAKAKNVIDQAKAAASEK